MKFRRIVLAAACAAVWIVPATTTYATDNGTVDAQVTVAMPCLEITDPTTTIDFGTLGFSASTDSVVQGSTTVTYHNCSAMESRVWAQGTDAQGTTATWALDNPLTGTPCAWGVNRYRLALGLVLGTTAVEIESALAGDASATKFYYLTMPCAGSDGAGETMSFRVTLTATF